MDRRQFLGGMAAVGAGAAGLAAARPAQAADVVIGLSNGYFGSEWRNQMVAGAQAQFDMYKSEGKASKLIVQQAGADINQQIQDVRNMILQGVSVITMDPNSGTALDSVINEAKRAGIPVIAFDQAVQNRYALSVTIDHYTWATRYAEWVAKTLNGKGKVVVMDGIPGNPAAETRRRAAHDVFAKYPGIHIIASAPGMWSQAVASTVLTKILTAHPWNDINGLWMQVGCYTATAMEKQAGIADGAD